MTRRHNLDYLRGFAAFSIMIYHYLVCTVGRFSADSVMGRYGIYGVGIFFVLSGLTLYLVHHENMKLSAQGLFNFFKKRVFRIFPLLWVVVFASVLLEKKTPHLSTVFMNLSGLFSLVNWNGYIGTGVWSIGNELVFYLFFPVIVFLSRDHKTAFWITSLAVFLVYVYFGFIILDTNKETWEQWRNYVNPLNQAFLFMGGFLIGYLFKNTEVKNKISLLVLATGVSLLLFYPVEGTTIHLVTGFNRLVFTISCFLICWGFYKLNYVLPPIIHKPLIFLGHASYSVYMLHPLVYTIFGLCVPAEAALPDPAKFILCVIITLVLSYFSYTYFEKFFMKLGRENQGRPVGS